MGKSFTDILVKLSANAKNLTDFDPGGINRPVGLMCLIFALSWCEALYGQMDLLAMIITCPFLVELSVPNPSFYSGMGINVARDS